MANDARPPVKLKWLTEHDGVDHINVNPRGKTELGRLMADYSRVPFRHPFFGPFNSLVGYWHYIKVIEPNDPNNDALRMLWGKAAAKLGKNLQTRNLKHFQELIFEGNYYKIDQNPLLKELLIANDLPFALYYEFGPGNLLINPPSTPWLVPDYERLAEMFKRGEVLKPDPKLYEDFPTISKK